MKISDNLIEIIGKTTGTCRGRSEKLKFAMSGKFSENSIESHGKISGNLIEIISSSSTDRVTYVR